MLSKFSFFFSKCEKLSEKITFIPKFNLKKEHRNSGSTQIIPTIRRIIFSQTLRMRIIFAKVA
jgi:hypothetical protein